jgi:hypothetical protein
MAFGMRVAAFVFSDDMEASPVERIDRRRRTGSKARASAETLPHAGERGKNELVTLVSSYLRTLALIAGMPVCS